MEVLGDWLELSNALDANSDVLILVVMEVLGDKYKKNKTRIIRKVLILVVMEVLGDGRMLSLIGLRARVLILVVMEVLGDHIIGVGATGSWSLNPCCNGSAR